MRTHKLSPGRPLFMTTRITPASGPFAGLRSVSIRDRGSRGPRNGQVGVADGRGFPFRARASRSRVGAPSVSPFGELDGEDQDDCEIDLGETVVHESIAVAADLPEGREPALAPATVQR